MDATRELAVHFFTIVLNGEPFIRYHIGQMKQLPFRWRWHIIEGVAELKHDTAWSVAAGGRIPASFHASGRSVDGTSAYLDEISLAQPDRVTVYRKPLGAFWNGKREMVNAPLADITEPCLLWQVDADEMWTAEQFTRGRKLFLDHPSKTAAFYFCNYFVGPALTVSTRGGYGNNSSYEWLRTWRFRPGMQWAAHEPPVLGEKTWSGAERNVASIDPFLHAQTEAAGLVFQHLAYVTFEQLKFKEDYYGYKNAVDCWLALQAVRKFPVYLKDYFPWVRDATQVRPALDRPVVPLPPPALGNRLRSQM